MDAAYAENGREEYFSRLRDDFPHYPEDLLLTLFNYQRKVNLQDVGIFPFAAAVAEREVRKVCGEGHDLGVLELVAEEAEKRIRSDDIQTLPSLTRLLTQASRE